MNSPIHILHLEDDPSDAALIQLALKAGGIDCAITCVQTKENFVSVLKEGGIDLVLSDFSLPGFDGVSAAAIVREQWPAMPLILVSGTLGEELAVDSLKSGATDYVLKERLGRLAPAVRRAMREVKERKERQLLEAQIVESQKMDVIGQLASGVAHDFNNILAVIMGYSDIMLQLLDPDDRLHNYVGEIRAASERAAGLTGQLLVFSRKQTVQTTVLDLNTVTQDLDQMLRRLIHENIEMVVVPGDQIGRINADAGHIGQVLMNLVVNARDAMPMGGKVTITTSNVTILEKELQTNASAIPGDYVMLSVSDTGTGMTDEVKAHLFEALFTTKPKGKGTGLGLATCQTIVRQAGGHIRVCSEIGKGTEFKIYYPRVDQPLDAAARATQAGPIPRGTETLLVVEDDRSVRHLARGVLEAQGYEVLCASNGQDALHVAREHQGSPIRMTVTDVIMPQMGGVVMAEWLKVTYPDMKILFTSGYTDDALVQHGVVGTGVEFLPKPYSPATLSHKVRELLDEQKGGAVGQS